MLNTLAAPQLATVVEDAAAPVGVVGTLVSALVDAGGPLNNFSDTDGDLPGIAITGTNLQGGSLWYSVNGGASWQGVGTVSATSPRYLAANATTRVYFQPAANFSGTITDVISFKAWDRSGILQQIGLGLDIDGEAAGDESGYSVSLSADGSTVAIGAPYNDGNGTSSGHVRIYRWNGTAWTKLGGDIDGEATSDISGWSVSLSADGSAVAIGAQYNNGSGTYSGHVRVYRLNGTVWTKLGGDINGETAGDLSGYSVSLSADGSTVSIGAPFNNGPSGSKSGHVRVYRVIGGDWVQLGADIDGEAAEDESGRSVSLSANGSTVAIGAPYNSGTGTYSGHVRVYRWNGTAWTKLGDDIDGEAPEDRSGYAVSLSADGSTVAIGAQKNDGSSADQSDDRGHVRVYRWNGVGWTKLGGDIDGEATINYSGWSVSLSADGSAVAIGAPYNNGTGTYSGHVRLYRWNGTAWTKLGDDIDGEAASDYSGWSVSLSADGSAVAIGAPRNDGSSGNQTDNRGHVRVYRLVPQASSVSTATDTVSVGVTALADAPVLVTSASPQLTGILEDPGAPVGAVGTLVSALVDSGGPLTNFSDADGDLPGIAITGVNLQGGSLWYSVNGGASWQGVGTVSVASPRYLAATETTRVYFQPAANFSGTITDVISFKAWDRTGILQQIGADIDGEAAYDNSGYAVSLSADGMTVAIGAPSNVGSDASSGHVRIYRRTGSGWAPLGEDIDGEAAGDFSGFSVSLSADGSTVAIGAIYSEGNGPGSGHTRIFRLTGSAWVQLGSDIDGEAVDDNSGYSVSLSADGSTVAIGAPYNDGNGAFAGHTRIFRWNGSTWGQVGADIDGEAAGDISGCSVSLSADGSTVAIGASYNDGNGDNAGRTRILRWNGLAWGQLGASIDGEAADDWSGRSVSLSADGSTVAIGAPTIGNGLGFTPGRTRIFRWSGSAWVRLGGNIDGEAADDFSGSSVSLSADGSIVAIGAPYNDGNGQVSGHVRVYRLPSVSLATDTVSVGVTALADAPVLVTTPVLQLPTILEDPGAPVGAVGVLVSSLVATGGPPNNFSDADGDLPGIAITNVNLQGGTLWFSVDGGGSWLDVGPVNVSSPRYLAANAFTRLYFQPGDSFNGTITDVISFKAWDRTGILEQIGLDIDGEAAGDYSGGAVSLSADGMTVAIGAVGNDGSTGISNDNRGHVRVFRWNGTSWMQVGADIDGEAASDRSGQTISLSADGKTLAITTPPNLMLGSTQPGHVRIYRWNGAAWMPLGVPIDGGATDVKAGWSASLSADGDILAVGVTRPDGNGNLVGYVRIYRWTGSAWTQRGTDIEDGVARSSLGQSVSLSADGITVAIGAPSNDGTNGTASGQTRIYRWNGTAWVQLGTALDGESAFGKAGCSVALSADGSTVAIGAKWNGDNQPTGHVRVYRWTGTAWGQLGPDLDSEASEDESGSSVSISADGNVVAIGAPSNDGNGTLSGHVRIYRWTGTAWTLVTADIDGEAADDVSGESVSLSADGTTVAIGAPKNDGGSGLVNDDRGHVRVYRLVPQASSVSIAIDTVGVAVTAVNDVPVLVTPPALVLPALTEDAPAPSGPLGTLVSVLVDAGGVLNNFSDADGDLPGIAITGTNLAGGTLWYSVDGGASWLDVGTVSALAPRYLAANATTRLYFQPAANSSGTIADVISFKAWDRTGILEQMGLDIDGEAAGDLSGYSVSLSADGSTVAIGSEYNDGNGTNSGNVRIFRWNGTAWTQLGDDIDGEAAYDQAGSSVSLSADGNTIAIGAPGNDDAAATAGQVRMYRWNGTAWTKLGDDIDGVGANDSSGWSVSLSADGSVVAIGMPFNDGSGSNAGRVRTYRWTGSAWTRFGADIDGEAPDDLSGLSVSLSADGHTLAIGAILNSAMGFSAGHVRVFRWNGTEWARLGTDIDGGAADEASGWSVSLSADGSTVAVGAPGNWESPGRVRVHHWNGTNWDQLGPAIDGEAASDNSGSCVSLSADGTIVAIGAALNDGNGSASGHVRVYRWNGSVWTRLVADIDGEATGDKSGHAVSLSADGSTVAIGAIYNDGVSGLGDDNRGHVRVYRLVPQATSVSTATETVSVGVTATADIPVLVATASPRLTAILENSPAPAGVVGTLVSALVDVGGPLANFSDPDGDLPGIAITGTNLQGGSLWYSVDGGGSWQGVGAVSALAPLYLAANAGTRLYFRPAAGFHGSIAEVISFKAWDRTGVLQQIGADIDGEAAVDGSGLSMSISADGTTVAIGAPENDGNDADRGHVRVYRLTNGEWTKLGADIDGEATDDQSGYSVSMSADGNTVAIGAWRNDDTAFDSGQVRVYRWNGTAWTQLGTDIDGEAMLDNAGWSVSLSADGGTVAVGAPWNNGNGSQSGHTRVFRWSGSAWVQLGGDIDGEAASHNSGYSVSLAADGGTVAIGAITSNAASGQVRVYRLIGGGWVQRGADIDGEANYDYSGWSVSLSADGGTVAIGAPYNSGGGGFSGHVRVYRWTGTDWTQLGLDIDGEGIGDNSGYSVSLSADGATLAIGGPGNDGSGESAGHVRIYRWTGSAWTRLATDIDGENAGDESGRTVSLSADGSTVAVGAAYNDGNGQDSGHVRVYRLPSVSTATDTVSVTVTDVNDAPTAVALTNTVASLPENTSTVARTKVADIVVTDDALGSETITLTGADAAAFEVEGLALFLRAGVVLDFEAKTSYAVTVSVADTSLAGSTPVTAGFTLLVTNVNDAPTAVALTNTVTSLPENTSTVARTKAADIVVTDDALGTETITLTGADAAAFEVEGLALFLRAGVVLDFEAKASYTVTVNVADPSLAGSTPLTAGFTLALTDVQEPAAITLPSPFQNTVTEDAGVDGSGFLVARGTFLVSDPDAGQAAFRITVGIPAGATNLGALTIDATGAFTYRVANALDAVQGLRAGQTRTDAFTIESIDGTKLDVSFSIVGVADVLRGMVADGYLAGATVFADTNGNRVLDAGELSTTTDSLGNFSLDFGSLTATLVSTGGTDISTGLPFAGSLTAPAGSTVINPLTTLVTAVIEAGGSPADATALAAAVTAATTQVVAGLGLPVVNLTTFDPLAPGADAPTALAVQKAAASVANVIVVANAVGAAPAAVVRNLATAVTSVGAGQTVNLGSDAVLTTVLTTPSTPTPSAAAVSSLAVANGQIANAVTIDAIAALQTVVQSASTFVAEGAAADTVVFQAATPVGMTAAVFSLKDVPGDDRALVSIDAATGAVRLLAPADYETKQTYRFTVVAAQEGRSTVETTVTVAVTTVNEAPTTVSLDDPSVPENSAVGTVVGTLSASDPDAGDTVTYALVAGNGDADNAAFTLDGATLRTARTFNFETRAAYSIRVRATDAAGSATETSFTIGVADVPDEALVVERITAQAPASYRAGQRVRFTVTLSEAAQVTGKPQLQLRAGSATKAATYVSGSGSSILTFEYVVGRKDNASAVTIGQNLVFARNSAITAGTERLPAALPASVASAAVEGVRFDAVAPKVTGRVTAPGNGTYTAGQSLDFVVQFSEAVVVAGTPQIGMTGLTSARQATYVSGSGSQALTFRYVVQAGDAMRGTKGLALARAITMPGGATIADAAGNRASATISSPSLKGIRIDTTPAVAVASLASEATTQKRSLRPAAFASLR